MLTLRAVLADVERAVGTRTAARQLVAAVLDMAPGDVTRRIDASIADADVVAVRRAADRFARGEPMAYATGYAAFRELVLAVDPRVLVPRPETEIVVEAALARTRDERGGIAVDIGTGSGAIALSLALEGTFDRVIATDLSRDALDVAAHNLARHPALMPRVELRAGSFLDPLRGVTARLIVSNPPYIAYDEAWVLPPSVRDWEPPLALFTADGGMASYEALLRGAQAHLEPDGWLVLETDARRAASTAERAVAYGYRDVEVLPDLTGRDRVLVARAG